MRRGLTILVSGLILLQAHGGQLDDFEEKGKKKASSSSSNSQPKSQSSDSSSSSSFGSGTYPSESSRSNFSGDFLIWLITAPFQSRNSDAASSFSDEDENEGWADGDTGLFSGHTSGKLTKPYLRADYNRQHINSNLDAQDLRVEAGYKLLAFYGRHTLYTESNPSDELTLNQYYGLLRFGDTLRHEDFLNGAWEVGLGLGTAQQIGNEEHSSWALTVPVKFYPTDWFGVEFRPAWYRPQDRMIGDYDLSASLGWRFVQVRGGYRWLWMQGVGHLLNGPYAGVSISF